MALNKSRAIGKRPSIRKSLVAWAVALPSLALFVFFIWGPLVQNVIYSFASTRNFEIIGFNGLDNYANVFADARFTQALSNTLLYVLYSLLIGFIIPIILALLISEVIRTKSLFKVGFYIPNIVPAVAVILMWKIMMDANDYGFFNVILARLGLPTSEWIANDRLSIPLIVLTLTWKSAGATMLIYLATVQSIDNTLYEAARVKGLSVWKRLRYITIPALLPNVKLLLIIQIIAIFQIFYEPMIFMGQTNDSANTLGLLIYKLIYTTQDTGQAAALGVITMVILLGFTYVYLYFDRKATEKRTKAKRYIALDELLEKSEGQPESRFKSSFSLAIKRVRRSLRGLSRALSRVLSALLTKTRPLGLAFFRPKKEGILAYSDYRKHSRRIGYYAAYSFLLVGLFAVLLPFLWLFVTSFKNSNEI
ncbi:MAG: ABC transporter permease subunit, partial [Acholeplasmataceae bacterium]